MRFGFAGVKHPHAGGWANAVRDNQCEIVATYDPDSEMAKEHARAYGGVSVASIADLKDLNLDGVIVDGRCDEVMVLALEVLDLELPILIEKPGGMTSADLDRISRKTRGKQLPTQMGYFLRYAAPVREAAQMISSNELGTLTLVRSHAAMPHRAWEVMGDWFSDPGNITSIFQEDCCHVVDIMLHLLGMPKRVTAMRIEGNFDPSVGEDAIAVVLDYGSILATIDFNAREANPWIDTWSFELYGTEGTFRFGVAPEWTEKYSAKTGWVEGGETRLTGPSDGFARDASSAHQYRDGLAGLISAIRGEGNPPANVDAGLHVFRVVEAILQAADTGSAVELPRDDS